MSIGSGADTLTLTPSEAYDVDAAAYALGTRKSDRTVKSGIDFGAGEQMVYDLPQRGVAKKLRINVSGSVTITGNVDTFANYPHGLLEGFQLQVGGSFTPWQCSGIDLVALRHARHPAFEEAVDVFPGSIGVNQGVTSGDINLTYIVPIVVDDVSDVGAIYLQTTEHRVTVKGQPAPAASVFDTTPGGTVDALNLTASVELVSGEIPRVEGRLKVPDIGVIHKYIAQTQPWVSSPDEFRLTNQGGSLARLFASVTRGTNLPLSPRPDAAATDRWQSFGFEYGGDRSPFVYPDVASLLRQNNEHYGSPLPYDRLVLDQVIEHPIRDAIHMAGVTEVRVDVGAGGGVTIGAGARVRTVQELIA